MTIASEITRLQGAKSDARTSIINKGVDVPANAKLDTYHTYIDQIPNGNPDFYGIPIRSITYHGHDRVYTFSAICPLSFTYGGYTFWTLGMRSYGGGREDYNGNFWAYKEGWTDFKMQRQLSESISSGEDYYYKSAGYVVNDNLITLWIAYTTNNSSPGPYTTLTATFNLTTGEWTGVGTGSSEGLVTHGNDLISSVSLEVTGGYGYDTAIAIFTPNG